MFALGTTAYVGGFDLQSSVGTDGCCFIQQFCCPGDGSGCC